MNSNYINRDGVDLPSDLPNQLHLMLLQEFQGADIRQRGPSGLQMEVVPTDESSFTVDFFLPEMITCDGTPEQEARVALCIAARCREHKIRIVMTNWDFSRACAIDEEDGIETLLAAERWIEIDPTHVGAGDIMQSCAGGKKDPTQHSGGSVGVSRDRRREGGEQSEG